MARKDEASYKYSIDISELKKGITDANRKIKEAQSEFKAASAAMEDWENTTDGLEAKLKSLDKVQEEERNKLVLVEKQLQLTNERYGESSAQATNMRIKFNNQQAALNKVVNEYNKYSQRLDDVRAAEKETTNATDDLADGLEEANDAAGKTDGYTMAKDVMSNLMSDGIEKVTEKVKDMVLELSGAQTAYNNFSAKTGAVGQEYNDAIDSLYNNAYGSDRTAIAEAMAEVQQQTNEMDSSKLEDYTAKAMLLEETFGYDVQESMRAVNMLMEQFGVTSDEAFNMLTQASQAGLNKNGDLLDTVNEYSVHYKQLGYSAEEMFNSLQNGTAEGTFSVDKLGDAMKEFGIRTKDTATTTQEGFGLLGYSAGVSAEQIQKAEEEIAKLEKNLSYAQAEQAGFNEKTSDLTRQKNADKIAEYSDALEAAKRNLNSLKNEGKGASGSIADLQARFAKGGDTAKKATAEVLKKLFSMDDKVKQNQAGVDLFGTMWEDLGVDAIKALTDTQGEISKTTDAMEEIKDLKYDDVNTQLTQMWREIETEFVKPVVEKAIPEIKNGVTWVKSNLPTIVPVLSTIAGIIAGMWTITKVGNFISAITSIATPVGAVTAVVGALATAIGGVALALQQNNFSLPSDVQEHIDKVNELSDAYNTTHDNIKKAADDNTSKYSYYEGLWDELQKIVDQNGKIKDGYKEHAEFISNELSKAMGKDGEIKIVDGVVQKWKELKNTVDETLKLQQAKSMLSSYEDSYSEAVTKQGSAQDNYNKILSDINAYESQKKQKEQDVENLTAQILKTSELDVYKRNNLIAQKAQAQNDIRRLNEVLSSGDNALYTKLSEAEKVLTGYNAIIENYGRTQEAIINGDANKVQEALTRLKNEFVTADTGTKQTLEAQIQTLTNKYNEMKSASQVEGAKVNEQELSNMKSLIDLAKQELEKYKKATQEKTNATNKSAKKAGEELTESIKKGIQNGIKDGKIKAGADELKNAIDNELNQQEYFKNIGKKAGEDIINAAIEELANRGGAKNIFSPQEFSSIAEENNSQNPLTSNYYNTEIHQNFTNQALSPFEIYRNTKNIFNK